ncbi:MAG TPA: hypothetical protein GXX55_03360 [Firmicutes bacterium]|nr:hypothetical protein [Bacillota bacterium]
MAGEWLRTRLTEADLAFVVEAGAPHRPDPERVARMLRENPDFVDPLLEKDEVFQFVMGQRERLLKLSPFLLFYILLLRVRNDLRRHPHTPELVGHERLLLFDGAAVARLLSDERTRVYLAEMLASFARSRQFLVYRLEADGKVRPRVYSDTRVEDLIELLGAVPQASRYPIYRRLGDLCLLLTGLFPESTPEETRTQLTAVGTESYRRAARTARAEETGYRPILEGLADQFDLARKPLHLLRHQYLAGVFGPLN